MQWDDMRIFLAVARSESLSAAGRELRIDPATAGRRIARLEQEMGAALFVKSPQGYALTEAGERLMGHAREAEAAFQAGAQALRGQGEQIGGTLRIGAPDGCATYLLPQVCARLAQENPGLDIQIVSLPRVVNLSRREADLAIAVSPPETGRLLVQKITDYHLHLAAMRWFVKGNGPFRTLDDLAGQPIVGYIPDMIFDKELDYLGALGMERVQLASNSISVQFQWIKSGAGLGIVHDFMRARIKRMVRVLPEVVSLTRSFYLVRHADDRRLERMNRLAEALAQGLRAEVARLEAKAEA